MRKLVFLLIIIGLGIGLSLCHKPDTLNKEGETEISKNINELDVDDNFKWKTIKDVQVSLTSATDEVAYIKSDKGDVYLKAFLNAGHMFNTKITIPTYVTEVVVVCKGQSQTISIVGGNLDYNFK